MKQHARLKKLERHPQTVFRQEFRRLQKQDAIPLSVIAHAIWNAPENEGARVLRCVTDAQLVQLVLQSELTPQQREQAQDTLQSLGTLEEQARRNVELMLQPLPSAAKIAEEEKAVEYLLTSFGLRPASTTTQAQREGYEAI